MAVFAKCHVNIDKISKLHRKLYEMSVYIYIYCILDHKGH